MARPLHSLRVKLLASTSSPQQPWQHLLHQPPPTYERRPPPLKPPSTNQRFEIYRQDNSKWAVTSESSIALTPHSVASRCQYHLQDPDDFSHQVCQEVVSSPLFCSTPTRFPYGRVLFQLCVKMPLTVANSQPSGRASRACCGYYLFINLTAALSSRCPTRDVSKHRHRHPNLQSGTRLETHKTYTDPPRPSLT
ncbi:hypothetical protein ElyMa_002456000 [Elysia marginata]|uniref:Uncharacterized protein n=1 Tax=Elysia marginata TaxID=1093978 RepID=A0AAV4GLW7_9GAST|nr:hypothetical protein ElyMa_002456000 [Elysia marginata]